MNFETIEFNVEDGVARLTLNRPDKLNSFNAQMHDEVREALRTVTRDDDIRCLLLSGNGRGGIDFFPDGTSTGGRITLALEGRNRRIDIEWLTGRIRVAEDEP